MVNYSPPSDPLPANVATICGQVCPTDDNNFLSINIPLAIISTFTAIHHKPFLEP